MVKEILFIILIGFSFFVLYIKYIEHKGPYYPDKKIKAYPSVAHLDFQDIYITTEDGVKINGWFIPSAAAKYTLLFCHGNAGNISDRIDKISLLSQAGLNIFIFDYRGFGNSLGRPFEIGLYRDTEAAYNYLVNSLSIKPENIILYGESLGSAAVIDLASRKKVKSLIIEGGFSCGKDMAKKIYPFFPRFLITNSFDSISKIKSIEAPKLFIHSREDELVPIELAKKLYSYSSSQKYFIEISGSHNDAFLVSKQQYLSSIASFIE